MAILNARERADLAQEDSKWILFVGRREGCVCTWELRLVPVDSSDSAAQDDGEEQTQELDDDDAKTSAQNERLVVFLPL